MSKDQNIINTKQCRVDIDACIQSVKGLNPSDEVSIATIKLKEAVMWLGMNLKALNEPNPYPNSRDVTNTIIEPTADGLKL